MPNAGFSVTFVGSVWLFHGARASAALIISHFEAVAHFCQSINYFGGTDVAVSRQTLRVQSFDQVSYKQVRETKTLQ